MNLRNGTVFFIVSVVAAIAIYDVIAVWRGGPRATISSVIITATYTPPWGWLIPFVVGGLVTHLFWPQKSPR